MDPPDCKLEKKLSSMDPPDCKLEKKLSGPHDYKLEKAIFILGGFLSCFITSLFYLMFPRYFLGTELVTSLCLEEKNGVSKISRNHKPGRTGGIHSAVYLYEKLLLANQMYYAVTIDRTTAGPFIISWRNGGTSIEGIVKKFPNMIIKVHIDVSKGIMDEDAAKVVDYLAPKLVDRKESIEQVKRLYNLFCDYDRTLLEINPIAETSDGQLITADPKLSFYDNAAFRQKEIVTLWDSSHQDPREVAAAKADLNYIGLDGEIGCIVNGAGLAMATMDVIKLIGGTPASFLVVGGNASEDQVVEAFKILTSDEKVKAILVNIFGRIMKCDVIATGIVNAAKQVQLKVPVVVRLEGRNVDQGMRILKESGMTLITAEALYDAAVKAVQAV